MNPTRLLASSVLLLLGPFATAQLQSGMPPPMPGTPMTPPPVDHPALGAQPGFDDSAPRNGGSGGGGGPTGPARPAPKPMDPDTFGKKRDGKDLKKAVAKVKALKWTEDLTTARAMSAATGKPILWLQTLGDLEGFA
jgi:hypothetical protein